MLRKKFSMTLLALVVAAAIPGSAFAADIASEAAGQVSAPTSVSEPANSDNTAATPENTTQPTTTEGQQTSAVTPATEGTEATTPVEGTEPTTPAEVKEPAKELQTPDTEPAAEPQPAEVVTTPTEETKTPTYVQTPAEDVTTPAEPAEVVTTPTEPVVPAEEVIIPEIAPIEEIATEPAIVVEPVEATVTITQRLYFSEGYEEYTQTIDNLEVGQELDVSQYVVANDEIQLITEPQKIVLEKDNNILLEYKIVSN